MFNPNDHMMKLKGKDYLQVAWRLVWFRDEENGAPGYGLRTELMEHGDDWAVFKAIITDENGNIVSTGHGSESSRDFGDYLEKAETKAVGRALAMLGYGTQFAADELDEGERIVDSHVNRKPSKASFEALRTCADCGKRIERITKRDGSEWTVDDIVAYSQKRFDRVLCPDCQRKAVKTEE